LKIAAMVFNPFLGMMIPLTMMVAPCNPTRVVKIHTKQKKRKQRRLSTSVTDQSQMLLTVTTWPFLQNLVMYSLMLLPLFLQTANEMNQWQWIQLTLRFS